MDSTPRDAASSRRVRAYAISFAKEPPGELDLAFTKIEALRGNSASVRLLPV